MLVTESILFVQHSAYRHRMMFIQCKTNVECKNLIKKFDAKIIMKGIQKRAVVAEAHVMK